MIAGTRKMWNYLWGGNFSKVFSNVKNVWILDRYQCQQKYHYWHQIILYCALLRKRILLLECERLSSSYLIRQVRFPDLWSKQSNSYAEKTAWGYGSNLSLVCCTRTSSEIGFFLDKYDIYRSYLFATLYIYYTSQ